MITMRLFIAFSLASALIAGGKPPFRTDADGPVNPKAEKKSKGNSDMPGWFQLVAGQFPPEGSAHAISGELIKVDHLERRFQIRVDRNDSQDRGVWDLPLDTTMLPYGSIWCHGAPAALQDIPLGTHLHGLFYLKDPADQSPPPDGPNRRVTPESDFRRCFRIEDDFTFHARQKQLWKIESVDLEAMKLNAALPGEKAKTFDLLSSTRVFESGGFTDLKALQPGRQVLFNLTWATLYGPGRLTDVWLDDTARTLATAQQLERHRNHIRERGLPGWVTAVNDEQETVTVTFFGGIDELLLTEWRNETVTSGYLVVARESLMTYDPVNDKKSGNILEVKNIPAEPGSSGLQIHLKMDMMLEGYRPTRIVRFYPSTWKITALPREEEFFGRD